MGHDHQVPSDMRAGDSDEALLRDLIAFHLRNCSLENIGPLDAVGARMSSRRVSGAIFLSMSPRVLKLFIADARTSIALALQRHTTNERYRKRLASEHHFRALRPHLNKSFREAMVAPSNSSSYRYPTSRGPSLALAYQAEIERLEMELKLLE